MLCRLINAGITVDIGHSVARKIRIINVASLLTTGLFGLFLQVLIANALWFHACIYSCLRSVHPYSSTISIALRMRGPCSSC